MPSQKTQRKIGLLFLAYIAFISLGLPDGLLGVAWPSIRKEFALPLDSLGLLLAAATSGYLVSSFFSGKAMARLGVGGLLAASCLMTGLGLLGYTLVPAWWMILLLGIVAGMGAGAIDAGINTYIASEHSEDLMQWLHASFGVGITLGPIIMTTGINTFTSWRWGYTVVGVAQVSLAVCFALTASLWKREDTSHKTAEDRRLLDFKTSLRETLIQPSVWLSLVMFFLYTGIEMTLGAWAYTLLTESRGIAPQTAGLVAGSYWATFTIGRILAGLYTRRISNDTILKASLVLALTGALVVWWDPLPMIGVVGVALVGFAIAPIFPALVSGTSERVGARHGANTIGMQMSAAGLGGAAVPGLAGVLARNTSLEAIPVYLSALVAIMLGLYLLAARKKAKLTPAGMVEAYQPIDRRPAFQAYNKNKPSNKFIPPLSYGKGRWFSASGEGQTTQQE
jgi:fucose permease